VIVSFLKTAIAPVVGEEIWRHFSIKAHNAHLSLRRQPNSIKIESVAIAPFGTEYSPPQPMSVGQVHILKPTQETGYLYLCS